MGCRLHKWVWTNFGCILNGKTESSTVVKLRFDGYKWVSVHWLFLNVPRWLGVKRCSYFSRRVVLKKITLRNEIVLTVDEVGNDRNPPDSAEDRSLGRTVQQEEDSEQAKKTRPPLGWTAKTNTKGWTVPVTRGPGWKKRLRRSPCRRYRRETADRRRSFLADTQRRCRAWRMVWSQ